MNKFAGTDEAWEERQLGADADHAEVAGAEHMAALDEAMGMQSISIRLPKGMIDAYKLIGAHHGVGYQPLMRDILQRFIPEGLKEVLDHHQQKATQAEGRIEELRKAA
ncbi:hypothetical protein QRO11_15300 [Paracidovorax citrulli]|uniref:Uncharacterized protein n=2 Tax=Paracidovorax citrulli TaxID=80869 RepID=A1TMW8_PARC0|nr:hypothetical protein [Paracidovorax citrulli]ABM32306.1 conserved hypothetical protein [Paracidovorax citrulli AAC00-1]ATG94680.1 hypothetical protein CQB05_12120 [Paracidovorax citrulli]MVT28156.1 hypothetical protein [Paracidovorax citrulli]MVT30154.1 hypothetical protein [Paracidovorax citrulli]PVY66510.1 hypothetical protein C8E08_3918 [Paracidovorax citrulli]